MLVRVLLVLMTMLVLACQTSCGRRAPSVLPPTGDMVFWQHFEFADGSETSQGSGWMARSGGEGGRIIAVTSAHFLDPSGPAMVRATWMRPQDLEAVATSTKSLGRPGSAGVIDDRRVDLKPDYLMLIPERAPAGVTVFEFDDRPGPNVGEPVWLVYNPSDGQTARLISGVVKRVLDGGICVGIDEKVELNGRSGSPIISAETGKVLGTLSRAEESRGRASIWLAPAASIRAAMESAIQRNESYPLRSVVGQ